MLAFFGIFLTLIIAINLGQPEMAEATTCCLTKKVGGVTYTLISHRDTSSYNCLADCIYRTSELGSLYCFSSGTDESECITTATTSSTTTTTRTSTTSIPTTTTSAISSADASRTTSPLSRTTVSANPWFVNQISYTLETIAESGMWGPDEFCPEAAYATSFQLYVAPLCTRRCNLDDDVALMGIKLFCARFTDPSVTVSEITSSIMSPCERRSVLSCDWMRVSVCPVGQFLTKSRYLSQYFQDNTGELEYFTCPPGDICRNSTTAFSDHKGGLNIDMSCTDGTELLGDGIMPEEVPLIDGQVTTFWSEWNKCPAGFAVCGIRSKVHQGETDRTSNMGQTEVLFHCCQLPPGVTG